MRPHAPRGNHWVQLGIYACALLLPPLALGAALYSMLAPPYDDASVPAAAQTALHNGSQPRRGDDPRPAAPIGPPGARADGQVAAVSGVSPVANTPPVVRPSIEGMAQGGDQGEAQGPAQGIPFRIAAAPAAEARVSAGLLPAEGPPKAVASPKRPHRSGQPHQQQQQQQTFSFKAFLQQIGILPRDGHG
jgi:hypothetical protein